MSPYLEAKCFDRLVKKLISIEVTPGLSVTERHENDDNETFLKTQQTRQVLSRYICHTVIKLKHHRVCTIPDRLEVSYVRNEGHPRDSLIGSKRECSK